MKHSRFSFVYSLSHRLDLRPLPMVTWVRVTPEGTRSGSRPVKRSSKDKTKLSSSVPLWRSFLYKGPKRSPVRSRLAFVPCVLVYSTKEGVCRDSSSRHFSALATGGLKDDVSLPSPPTSVPSPPKSCGWDDVSSVCTEQKTHVAHGLRNWCNKIYDA